MITLNKLSFFASKVKVYFIINFLLVVFILSVVFSSSGQINFFSIFFIITVALGVPFYICILILYQSWTFMLNGNSITINSGVIVKKTKIISFDKVQNISCKQGILMRMLGISNFDIWTASPSQININVGKTLNGPDANLVLNKKDAVWLQTFMVYNPENNK